VKEIEMSLVYLSFFGGFRRIIQTGATDMARFFFLFASRHLANPICSAALKMHLLSAAARVVDAMPLLVSTDVATLSTGHVHK